MTHVGDHGQAEGGGHTGLVNARLLWSDVGRNVLRPKASRLQDRFLLLAVGFSHHQVQFVARWQHSLAAHFVHGQRDGTCSFSNDGHELVRSLKASASSAVDYFVIRRPSHQRTSVTFNQLDGFFIRSLSGYDVTLRCHGNRLSSDRNEKPPKKWNSPQLTTICHPIVAHLCLPWQRFYWDPFDSAVRKLIDFCYWQKSWREEGPSPEDSPEMSRPGREYSLSVGLRDDPVK